MRRFLVVVAAILIMLVTASPVLAHAVLVRSDPPADSAQKVPPKTVRAWFSEAVEPSFSSLKVLDKSGTRVDKGDSQRMNEDPTGLQVSLGDMADGLYTVVWTTESAVDGHVASGSFAFTVGPVALTEASPRGLMSLVDTALNADAPPPLSQVVVRWLNILFLALLVGALTFPALVLDPSLKQSNLTSTAWIPRWQRFARGMWVLSGLATLAMLLTQAAAVGGDAGTLVRVITATRFGAVLIIRVVVLLALGYLLFRKGLFVTGSESVPGPSEQRGRRPAWSAYHIAVLLGLMLLVTQSLNSHDAAVDFPPLLPLLTDFIHLGGTAIWVGGLAQLLVVLPATLGALDTNERPRFVANVIARFSLVAFITVGVIVLTGAYSMFLQVGSLEALFATLYGTTLLVKFLLIFVVLAIAALNLIVTRPAAAQASSERLPQLERRFSVAVAFEALFAAGILLAVGLMTSVAPAKTAYNPSPSFWMSTQRTVDLQVTLGVAPALAGTNDFDIKVQDSAGQPISNATVVRLLATMREMDMGTQQVAATNQGNGHYTLHADMMSMVGTWNLQVLVRRSGVDDAHATFSLLALGQRLPPPTPVVETSPEAQAGLGLTLLACALGTASTLLVKRRRDRWVGLGGAFAISLIGVFVVYQVTANAVTGTAFVIPVVPEFARTVHSPIAPVPNQIAAGQQVYQANCTVCHGVDGKGDGPAAAALQPKPADLTVHVPMHTDGELYWWITHGITTTAMPAWDTRLTDIQRWQVVQFLRQTFGTRGTPAAVAQVPASSPPLAALSPTASDTIVQQDKVEGIEIGLTVQARTAGISDFDVALTDAAGRPLADARRVMLLTAMPNMTHEANSVLATPTGGGHYHARGAWLYMEGSWQIGLVIQLANDHILTDTLRLTAPPVTGPIESNAVEDSRFPVQQESVTVYPQTVVGVQQDVGAGQTVRVTAMLIDPNHERCGGQMMLPQLGLSAPFSDAGLAEIEFVAPKSGRLLIDCGNDGLTVTLK